jgi:hypothetical protein
MTHITQAFLRTLVESRPEKKVVGLKEVIMMKKRAASGTFWELVITLTLREDTH